MYFENSGKKHLKFNSKLLIFNRRENASKAKNRDGFSYFDLGGVEKYLGGCFFIIIDTVAFK